MDPEPEEATFVTRAIRAAGAWALACIWIACGPSERPQLTVFAASSLTEAAGELEAAFEGVHPGVDVRFAFAGSQTLRAQIEAGAPADVFISADLRHMEALVAGGHATEPRRLVENRLTLIAPPHKPADISSFADLPKARRIVLAAPEVPAGAYAREVIARADAALGGGFGAAALARVVSEEPNVRLVRAKVLLGEADAAIVYATDARGADVAVVPIPDAWNAGAIYPVARLTRARAPALAEAFIALARGPEGRAIFERHGFRALTGEGR